MEKIEGKQALLMVFRDAMALFPAGAVLGLVIGAGIGMSLGSMDAFKTTWFLVAIGGPLAIVLRSLAKVNATYERVEGAVRGALGVTDYADGSEGGAIALDVSRGELAVVTVSANGTPAEPLIIPAKKVLRFKTVTTDMGQIENIGGINPGASYQTTLLNRRLLAGSRKGTGLRIDLDDVSVPAVFIQMSEEAATKWVRILEKLANGSLETSRQAAPVASFAFL